MAKTAGVDVLLKVKVASVYTVLGGQSGASLSRSASTFEVTDKNSGGWTEAMASFKSWSIECDAFVVLGDTAMEQLVTSFNAGTPLDISIRVGATTDANGYTMTGAVLITDFPEEYPQDDAVVISLTLTGTGALTRTKGVV